MRPQQLVPKTSPSSRLPVPPRVPAPLLLTPARFTAVGEVDPLESPQAVVATPRSTLQVAVPLMFNYQVPSCRRTRYAAKLYVGLPCVCMSGTAVERDARNHCEGRWTRCSQRPRAAPASDEYYVVRWLDVLDSHRVAFVLAPASACLGHDPNRTWRVRPSLFAVDYFRVFASFHRLWKSYDTTRG